MHRLTTSQQERLRRLVRRSPAFGAMRVVVHDDHAEVLDPEPLTLGFGGLVDRVLEANADDWPDVVDQYLELVLGLATTPSPDLDGPTGDLLDRIYLKLMPHDGPVSELPNYVQEFVRGLPVMIALDLPQAIQTLNDDHVAQHGYDVLCEAGLRNLTTQLPEKYAHLEACDIYFLEGSDYVGSLALVLPWLVEELTGEADPPRGTFVAIPSRNHLLFHIVRDRASADDAIGELARLAAELYAGSAYGLSSRVYWSGTSPPYEIEAAGHFDGTGVVTYYSNELEDALRFA